MRKFAEERLVEIAAIIERFFNGIDWLYNSAINVKKDLFFVILFVILLLVLLV